MAIKECKLRGLASSTHVISDSNALKVPSTNERRTKGNPKGICLRIFYSFAEEFYMTVFVDETSAFVTCKRKVFVRVLVNVEAQYTI
jgi:hypothetical protein